MTSQLHEGEAIVKEWHLTEKSALTLTNKRIVLEYNNGWKQFTQKEIKLSEFSRIEGSVLFGKVNAGFILLGLIFLALGAALFKVQLVLALATMAIGILEFVLGIAMGKRTGIVMVFYRPATSISGFVDLDEVLSLSASNLKSSVKFRSSKINREEAVDMFEKIGTMLLLEQETSEEDRT